MSSRRMKLFLGSVVILLLIFGYKLNHAYKDILEVQSKSIEYEAEAITNSIIAFRETYQNIFITQHARITEETINFLPVKATNDIAKNLSKRHGEVKIEVVSDRPRNPINQANNKQMKIIKYFNDSRQNKRYFKKETDGTYTFASPLFIEKSCLKCHDTKASAPPYIAQNYDRAFGYKIGDLRGIIEVSIAQSKLANNINETISKKLISTILFFVVIIIILYLFARNSSKQEEKFTVSHFSSKVLFFIIFLLLSAIIILTVNHYKKMTIEASLETITQTYTRAYQTAYKEKKRLSKIFFSGITKLGNIEDKLATLTVENKDKIREELYTNLEERYSYLKTLGVKQVHIHLPNNESFLRMHKPKKYGDDLTTVRPTVAYVNRHHKPIDGMEEGRIYYGLRFVYPLSKEGKHLGSIEISFGIDAITRSLMQQHAIYSNFFIKSSVSNSKNFKLDETSYIASHHRGYYLDKMVLNELTKVSKKGVQELRPAKDIQIKLKEMGEGDISSSLYDKETNTVFTIIPIFNTIEKENIAFLSIRSHSEILSKSNQYALTIIALLISILALWLYLVNILINKKVELELKVSTALEENIKQLQVLQQQSKMAQMGEMIGSIAHQWRQPLNEISTGIQNLKYDYKEGLLNDEKYIKGFIDKNKKIIFFMSQTIDDFRNFFRVDKEKKAFDILEATQGVINIQSAQLGNHSITVELSGKSFSYVGLESEYQQVILNVISNAKDVLIEKQIENPIIDIKIADNTILIKDNAGGIPIEILDRIFEPYFTTKEQGKGTGLGLYMSKMIIEENMGGELSVSNTDNGAKFMIKLNK